MPQSLTRRAEAYAARKSKLGVPSPRETEAWADGYRAAIRDVRRAVMNTQNDAVATVERVEVRR